MSEDRPAFLDHRRRLDQRGLLDSTDRGRLISIESAYVIARFRAGVPGFVDSTEPFAQVA